MKKSFKKKALPAVLSLLICAMLVLGLFNPTGQAVTFGDVNNDGVINVHDVVLVMRHVLDLEPLSEMEKELADVNADGEINVRDVTLLMQKSLGLIEHFPDLDQVGIDLIEEFIVEEGISPGKKMVIVILNVPDPENYMVKVGETELEYRESIEGFRGETYEDEARLHMVEVSLDD